VQAPAPERPITGGMATRRCSRTCWWPSTPTFCRSTARPDLRPARDRARPLDFVRLGGPGLLVAGAAVAPLAPARHELDPDLRRRHALAGARPGPGPDQDRVLVGLCGRRPALGGETPPAVVYLYAEDRKGEHPAAHLAEFQGVLQVDGYSGFKSLLAGRPPDQIKLAFCWAHAGGASTSSTGPRARRWRKRRCAGSASSTRSRPEVRGRPAEERRTVRQERSKPLVDALHGWLTAQLERVSGAPPGRGDPLRPAPLAGAGAVPRRRPARARHEHRRAGDPADCPGAQEHS
jgi:hypothetical protein